MSTTALVIRILIMCVVASAFVYMHVDMARARASVEQARSDTVKEESRGAAAQVTKQFLEDTVQYRDQVRAFFVPQDGTADALSLVEQLARAAKVEAKVTGADITGLSAQHLEELVITLKVRGAFTNVLVLTTMLESLPRVSSVRSISIESSDGGVWQGGIIVTFVKSKLQ